jgi:hypothetical protein
VRPRFVRFATKEIDPASLQPTGVLQAAYRLQLSSSLSPEHSAELTALIEWFRVNLAEPDRFVRTKSKGFYRRDSVGISWFKAESTKHVMRVEALASLLEKQGIPVQRLETEHPGYVVFEDAHQVVTIPFRDR